MYISVLMTTHNFGWNVVMYISVWMTIFSFWGDFRNVHFCTDDCILILNGFSSCTFLYGWLPSHFESIFVIYICVRMTTFSFWNGFSSYTFLHERLPFLFEWIVVIYISVRMTTFSFWIDLLHVHFCTDDYLLILNGFLSCIFLNGWLPSHFELISVMYISVRMTTISFWMDCCHARFCANDYHFFLERIFVMHVSVR